MSIGGGGSGFVRPVQEREALLQLRDGGLQVLGSGVLGQDPSGPSRA